MKAVLLSIRPKWCELIASGEKTIEVRKTRPKIETPFRCYIYCTNGKFEPHEHLRGNLHYDDSVLMVCDGKGKVIGEFVCDAILPTSVKYSDPNHRLAKREFPLTGLTDKEIMDYLGNGKTGYAWHISDLVIYDKPKDLGEFSNNSSRLEFSKTKDGFPWKWSGMSKPPQSWCYVEELR